MLCKKVISIVFLSSLIYVGCATTPKESVLVQVGEQPITESDLVATLDPKAKQTYLQFKKQQIDKLIAKKLLEQEAKKRQLSYEKFLAEEIFNKAKVDHDEVHAYYTKNKKQFSKKKHTEWEPEITKLLQDQKAQAVLKTLLNQLANKTQIQYHISTEEETTSKDKKQKVN